MIAQLTRSERQLAILISLVVAICGLLLMLGLRKHAGKAALAGVVLAVAAGIAPAFGS